MSSPDTERVRPPRFFTNIRRIPLLIGKAGNTRLPGGPYTVVQICTGVLVLVVGYNTLSVWGPLFGGFPLIRLVALLAGTFGAMMLAGQIPSTRRKVRHVASDTLGAVADPAAGTLNGRAVKLPRPHRVTGSVRIAVAPAPVEHIPTAESAAPVTAPRRAVKPARAARTRRRPAGLPAPEFVPTVPAARFASGLDRLLEQARMKES